MPGIITSVTIRRGGLLAASLRWSSAWDGSRKARVSCPSASRMFLSISRSASSSSMSMISAIGSAGHLDGDAGQLLDVLHDQLPVRRLPGQPYPGVLREHGLG